MKSSIVILASLLVTACSASYQTTSTATSSDAQVETVRGPSTAASLSVPPGHLPQAGQCRIWLKDTPPGRQARSRSCEGIVAEAPAGSMVLEGMGDKKHVRVHYIDERRAGTVARVVVFEASTGKFVRQERG